MFKSKEFLEPEQNTTSQFLPQANTLPNTSVEPAENSGQSQAGAGFGLTNFSATQAAADATKVQKPAEKKPFLSRRAIVIIILILLALLTLSGIAFGAWRLYRTGRQAQEKTNTTDKYSQQSITIEGSNQAAIISPNSLNANQQVDVNGSLQVSGSLRLVPTARPTNPIPGQQYIDSSDNKLYLYNGSQWIAQLNVVDLNAVNANIQNLKVQNATIANQVNESALTNVTQQGNTFNGVGQLVQLNGSGALPTLDASSLVHLDASNVASGTLNDSRLSSNVAFLDQNQTFSGNNTFKNTADSTSSFVVQNAAGTSNLFVADTTNTRIGIGTATPAYTLDVNGDVNIANLNALRIGGTIVCTNLGCNAAGGGGNYIQNDTNLQGNANFNIQSASDILPTTQVRARALQTANLSEWQDSTGVAVASISPSGVVAAASFAGTGTSLTGLNGTNISFGTVNDARLSANVALLNATQIFTGISNTFNGIIYANTVTPTSTLNIGSTTQTLNLQGNGSTLLTAVTGTGINTNTTTLGFQSGPTNNRTIHYEFERNITSGTYEVCSSRGNCQASGVGGGVTAPSQGTPNRIAKFTQAFPTQIADSIITDDGSGVGINNPTPGYPLDVNGNVNTNGQYLINGLPVCGGSGCTPSGGSGNYIQNSTSLQSPGNFNVQSAAAGAIGGIIRGNASQTADIFQVQNGAGTINQFKVGADGSTQVRTGTDSTTALTVQNASDVNLFTADTSAMQVGIGANYANVRLSVETSNKTAMQINQTGTDNILNLQKSGVNVASVSSTGAALFKNSTNSTTAFQIQNASASPLFVVDSTNGAVGVNKAPTINANSYKLDVGGNLHIDNSADAANIGLWIGSTRLCTESGCNASGGGGNYIQNTTSMQASANFYIESAATSSVGGIIQGKSGQTADLFQLKDTNGVALASWGATGKAKFKPSSGSDATDFFQVQNTAASTILDVDTTNSRVGIGTTTPAETLSVAGNALIGKRADTAATNYTQYQATVSTGYPNMYSGTYTGDGTANRTLSNVLPSGWGTPTVVIILPHAGANGAFRTADMPAGSSKALGNGGSALNTEYITNMGADSFTVTQSGGLGANVNGVEYSYIAIRPETGTIDGYFSYGTYAGNQTDNRTICINGGSVGQNCTNATYTWTPDFVMVAKNGNSPGMVPFFRTSEMDSHSPSDWSIGTAGAGRSDYIQSFGGGQFQIGGNTTINQNSSTYYYFAFKEIPGFVDVGKYTGNGTTQAFTDPGFQPEFAMTKTDYYGGGPDTWTATMKGIGMGAYANSAFSGWGNSLITSFDATGFTLGSGQNYVNQNSKDYYTFALKPFSSTSTVNGYSAGAVYNGKFYTATKRPATSEIFRYDGGTTYTKVSSGTAGKINGNEADASPVVNSIPTMKVYDGKLFAGTDTGTVGKAAVYYCSNGSGNCNTATDWTQVNTTSGTLDGGTTGIDTINSMSVVNGVLYVATAEPSGAEIYRYNGGVGAAVFTKISGTAGDINGLNGSSVIDGITLLNYKGQLYAGSQTGADGKAGLYACTGDTNWSAVNSTRGTFLSTANIDDVTAMSVYNGSLVLGTGDSTANKAEIYRYNGIQNGSSSGSTLFSMISNTAGQIAAGGYAGVDRIGAMTVYNGTLLASSDNTAGTGNSAVYTFDGVSAWSKLGTEADGTFGGGSGTTAVDGILFLTQYNDTLFGGSSKSSAGYIYTIAQNTSMSYALKFAGSSDGSFNNIGSMSFMSGDQSAGGFNNTGQFLLSHSLTTSAGAYDIAEDYQTSDDDLVAGDVVAIDPRRTNGFVRKSDLAQGDGPRLLGIVSTHPAFRLSQKENYDAVAGSRTVPVALAGRVPIKIDPSSESITAGDYLTASNIPGLATKTTQAGAVIAKALEGWQKGSGQATVEAFVSNTFLLPGSQSVGSSQAEQIIAAGKPITIFDAFLATADNSLQVLKNLNVFGSSFFKGKVDFASRLTYHDKDSAGHAAIYRGQTQVEVKFDKSYDQTPVVSVTPLNFVRFKIINKTRDGFTIQVQDEVADKVEFDWMAVNLVDPKTFESPTPIPN